MRVVVSERQKMRADGPSVKLIADVPLILRRIIDTAKDFPDFRRNYLYRKIMKREISATCNDFLRPTFV